MPRKKPIQPEPIETFTLDDGTIVEIRDETCSVRGKGLHKRETYERKRDAVLEKVASEYLTTKGRKAIPKEKDYLSNATKFASKAELWGFGSEDGADNSALRKKLYKDIKMQITALENAINNKQKL